MWLARIWVPFQLTLSPLLNAVTFVVVVLSGVRVPRKQMTLTALPADALVSAKLQLTETEAVATAHAERIIADAEATARDIIAEAERAAQDLVVRAIKIKAEADRALDDARGKAVCIQKRAQAALALAENIAEGRRLIDALSGSICRLIRLCPIGRMAILR